MSIERDENGLQSRRDGNVLHIIIDKKIFEHQASSEALLKLISENFDTAGIQSVVILPRKDEPTE